MLAGRLRQSNESKLMIPVKDRLEHGGFLLFLAIISIGLMLIVSAFMGALLGAVLGALLFQPLFQRLLRRCKGRRNMAAALTLLIITIAVVIPAMIITSLVVGQAAEVYDQIRSGQINVALYFGKLHSALPLRLQHWLDTSGFGSFDLVEERVSQAINNSVSLIARQALSIGANAASFLLAFGIGLYVMYFLLRDGEHIGPAILRALPIKPAIASRLAEKFVVVVRATIKGSGLVALAQGSLGAVTFWIVGLPAALLWGMLMVVAALLPAIGPAIVWGPVAVYLLATGAIWQAVVVVFSGMLVIGLVDNILRPLLVGRDTGIPDWLVLVTTLGGIEVVGISGIVVGPLVAALFLTGWQILTEQRKGTVEAAS